MKLTSCALLAWAFAAASAAAVKGPLRARACTCNATAVPLPPSQDPWYSAPANFSDAAPGAILKVRNACNLVPHVVNSSAAYQFVYRTTDSRYQPTWAVTTLIFPLANSTGSTHNLLSYQIPYDSADVDSGPSYALYSGGGLFGDVELTQALGRGLYILTPDYEGPNGSFTAGVQSGHATLDSVRAALSPRSPAHFPDSVKYAMWGYSGGALASEWAAELQVQYAHELNFAGAALGGLTPNVTSVLATINGTVYAGLAPSGMLGLASQYPDLMAYLNSELFTTGPYNATTFYAAKMESLAQTVGTFANQNLALYFKDGVNALFSPIARYVLAQDGIMGYHGVPQMPLFVYKAIGDDISPVNDTDILVNRYCDVDATIDYQRNTVGNHNSESINGRARAVDFLTAIFAGTYNATGCQISNVTVTA